MIGLPFPTPRETYDRFDESQFRAAVESALLSLSGNGASSTAVQSATLGAGNNNDFVLNGNTELLRITPNAAGSTLTGLAGGKRLRSVRIVNLGSAALTIAHQNTNSLAANRIITPDALGWSLAATDVTDLAYDDVTSRWRMVEVTPQLSSSTYTPTLTNVANLAASTAFVCQWCRVGGIVTVSGKVDVDPTLTATATELGISLPVASNFTANQQASGVAACPGIAGQVAAIVADTTNDRAAMQWIAGDITNQPMHFIFSYQVL